MKERGGSGSEREEALATLSQEEVGGCVCVTLRADRLTACPAVPGPSDSLFDTSAESGAPPGTSAAG